MNALKLSALLLALSILGTGCAAETADDASAEDTTADELRVAALAGTWEGTGDIRSIEFTHKVAQTLGGGLRGHAFNATIDADIRCVRAPCPSTTDVTGVFKTTGAKVTLASYDRPSNAFAQILGDYTAKIDAAGTQLTLTKIDGGTVQVLKKAGIKCGTTTCASGLYCCNPLRNMCAKPGMMCIQ
jgi:hypothetical protein